MDLVDLVVLDLHDLIVAVHVPVNALTVEIAQGVIDSFSCISDFNLERIVMPLKNKILQSLG